MGFEPPACGTVFTVLLLTPILWRHEFRRQWHDAIVTRSNEGGRKERVKKVDRIEHDADVIVRGDPLHLAHGVAVGTPAPRALLQSALVGQERRALHEKDGKCRHADIDLVHILARAPVEKTAQASRSARIKSPRVSFTKAKRATEGVDRHSPPRRRFLRRAKPLRVLQGFFLAPPNRRNANAS
jgi:hypothetical protein